MGWLRKSLQNWLGVSYLDERMTMLDRYATRIDSTAQGCAQGLGSLREHVQSAINTSSALRRSADAEYRELVVGRVEKMEQELSRLKQALNGDVMKSPPPSRLLWDRFLSGAGGEIGVLHRLAAIERHLGVEPKYSVTEEVVAVSTKKRKVRR